MAYEDAVQLPNGAWFDITAFRARVLLLNATTPKVPDDGRIKLANGQTFDVELMVARLGLADGGTALATPDSLHGIRLPNGNVYDAQDLNRRLVARDGGASCFLTRIGASLTSRADDVRLKVTPGGFMAGGDGTGVPPVVGPPPSISGVPGGAVVGNAFSFTPTLSDGTAPYLVTAVGLPAGVSIATPSTGATTGSPSTAGTFSVVYTVTDSTGATASMTRSFVVAAATALGPLAATIVDGAQDGSAIATITGLGPSETVQAISPGDGRVVLASSNGLVKGLTAFATGTVNFTITTNLRSFVIAITKQAAAALLTKTLGSSTASGVSFAQLPAGASITTPGSAPGSYFSIDANGLVTTNAAFVSAALGSTTLDVAITGGSPVQTLRVNTVAGQADVDTAAKLTAAITAAAAGSDSVGYLTDTFVDGVSQTTITKVFSGTITHSNFGKGAVESITTPSSVSETAVPTVSGGSFLVKARTNGLPRFNNRLVLTGAGPVILDGLAFRTVPLTDAYNAKFGQVTQEVKWTPAVSTSKTSAVTISQASPAVVTWTGHGLAKNWPVVFTTTGAPPTGITAGTTYYVDTVPTADTLTLRTTPPGGTGAAVNTTAAGSGTHTATTTAGAVVGLGAFVQTGAGYLASVNERRVYIATKASGNGSGFNGWFAANNDGTIDANSPLTVTVTGTGYDTATQFRQPTLPETTQLATCQTNEGSAVGAVQLQILPSGSVVGKTIVRNCSFGNPGGSVYRPPICIDVRNADQFYLHDSSFDNYYIGLAFWQVNDGEVARVFSKGNTNDFYRQYPASAPLNNQANVGPLGRVLGCVCVAPCSDVSWSNSHADFVQVGTPTDAVLRHNFVVRFNRVFWPGEVKLFSNQFLIDQQGPLPYWFDVSDNGVVTSTQNAQAGSAQDRDKCHFDRNTYFRYVESDLGGVNALSPGYPACIEPWANFKGTYSSSGQYDYGDVVTDGAATPTYYVWKFATRLAGQALTNTTYWAAYPKYDMTISNNIIGAIWPAVPTATTTDKSKLITSDPAGGVFTKDYYNYAATGNKYVSNFAPNTGAGNSMPEVLSGGTAFFDTYGGPDIGWRGYINKVRTDTFANAKADFDAAFSTKAGTAYSGAGYRQAA